MRQQMRRALLMAAGLSIGAPALVECISVLQERLAFGPQQPRGGSTAWTPPRTPWGHPDLQGYWTNTTTTPLQRSAEPKDNHNYQIIQTRDYVVINVEMIHDARIIPLATRGATPDP